ncbi:hypothetical protein, partial [Pseudomonas putida]|uniref:hypothetical protein n=1 Tax=Pseudomonas putida TaxID=303 RepID=UPI0035D4027F
HHFHTDHPVFSCSKIEQKQLNTWVSFQSAEQPLLGQFSVSGNSPRNRPTITGDATGKLRPTRAPGQVDANGWPSECNYAQLRNHLFF